MVAVLGISESSKAGLVAQLNELGTNLLTVAPGQTFLGKSAELPEAAERAVRNLSSVRSAAAVTAISSASVRRNPYIEAAETGGIGVYAADPELLATLGGTGARGPLPRSPPTNATRWSCSARSPRSASASTALTVDGRGVQVYLGEHVVHGRRRDRSAAARTGNRTRGADRLSDRPPPVRHEPARDDAVRARRPRNACLKPTRCWPRPPTRRTPKTPPSAAPPPRCRHEPTPRARSPPCSSGSAPSRCSWAAWGSRT